MAEDIKKTGVFQAPIVSWHEDSLASEDEVTEVIDYGTVEAGDDSEEKVFFIMNNRNGKVDVPKMEKVTFTSRDRAGGEGDTEGDEVEAVKNKWFNVRVDTLGEKDFVAVGKGAVHSLGTHGETTTIHTENAIEWSEKAEYNIGDFIKPTEESPFLYLVTVAGTTGEVEPEWIEEESEIIKDGTVEYRSYKIVQKPSTQEILGMANVIGEDGGGAEKAAGNWAKVTVFAKVPEDAKSGLNELMFRVSYQYV